MALDTSHHTAQEIPAHVRERLKRLIDEDDRTASEIAKVAGMSPAQLHQTLIGFSRNPTVTTVGRILHALGRDWDALV